MTITFLFSQFGTGTTAICNALQDHPEIACPHEPLIKRNPPAFEDYVKVAEGIANRQRKKTHIVLQAHYDHISNDMINSPHNKILLYREDYVLGAIRQLLLNIERADNLFYLPKESVDKAILDRMEKDRQMRMMCNSQISMEALLPTPLILDIPKESGTSLLTRIGVENTDWQLKVKTPKHRTQQTPKNIGELYAR